MKGVYQWQDEKGVDGSKKKDFQPAAHDSCSHGD